MDYTRSDANIVHTATGQRMHQQSAPVPTVVSSDDMNMVIWSLMEVIKAAGLDGQAFNADDPETYRVLSDAISSMSGLTQLGDSSTAARGDALVAVKRTAAGAVSTTLHLWLEAQRLNLKSDFSVAGDKVTVDTAKFQAAIDAALRTIDLPAGVDSLVGTLSNPLGKVFRGDGRMSISVPGGLQQLNLSADIGQHVFGQEYLYAWFAAISAQLDGAQATAVFSGDSTTYGADGNGATAPFLINQVVEWLGRESGYNVSCLNRGQPGKNTYHWRTSYLAGDLAANPKLLVLRWGINDPGWLKDNTTPPLDAGQDYPNRRTIEDFAADLRGGLETIRTNYPVGTLSVLLMMPNSTSDTPNGRDERWYEQVRLVVRKAARDFQCAFIDTYSLWADSRFAAGKWMDDPFGDGRAIHPGNIMNGYIGTKIADLIFPRGLRPSFLPGVYGHQEAAAAPNDFKMGLNVAKVTAVDGFSGISDGTVLTFRGPDNTGIQIAWDNANAAAMPSIRVGSGSAWFDFLCRGNIDLVTANSWVGIGPGTDYNVRATKVLGMVTLWGTVKNGITTVGSVITTLPSGYRPFRNQWFSVPCGANMDTHAVVQVQPNGSVVVQSVPSNAMLSLNGVTFQAFG